MAEMTDQVVLVTGAAGNVGRALAVLLAGQGVRVAALDRAGTALLDGVADPAPHLPLAGVDLLDPAACAVIRRGIGTPLEG
jgi:NAD(P)-dependent dehydrogenase (short-subunit alcohol dehydrogenase family)